MDMFTAIRGRGLCCEWDTGSWKSRRQNKRARQYLKRMMLGD